MFVLLFIYLCLADKDLDTRYRNMTVSPFSTAENRIGDEKNHNSIDMDSLKGT
jgi:hypothetical protein